MARYMYNVVRVYGAADNSCFDELSLCESLYFWLFHFLSTRFVNDFKESDFLFKKIRRKVNTVFLFSWRFLI